MSLVSDTQDLLEELSYPWLQSLPLESLSLVDLSRALNWISQQLHFFSNTDSIVNIIQGDNEKDCLRIELNSLLKEVDSIYSDSFSLETANDRLAVLHSLIGNIFAARINYIRSIDSSSEFTQELNPRKDLTVINSCLSISDDLKDIKLYFQKVKEKLDKHLSKFHEEDSLLLPDGKSLSQEQWSQLKKLNEMLRNEYSIRREMMLRRVDMTVNSFSWKEDTSRDIDAQLIKNIYSKARNRLSFSPNITLSHALAARSSDCNVLINDVISTNHVNCMIEVPTFGQANQGAQQRLQLHKYLIGSVPDRGGRPNEQSAPARETFSQQKQQRESFGNRGRGRGNHGGGYHRGGGHQGGGGYQGRGGYQGGGGGHQGGHRNYNQNQQRYITEQSNRVQNAGWQQSAGGYHNNYHNNQREANQFYHQEENYDQYQSGHQRFSGGYQTDNRQDNRSRGRGNYRSNRY